VATFSLSANTLAVTPNINLIF